MIPYYQKSSSCSLEDIDPIATLSNNLVDESSGLFGPISGQNIDALHFQNCELYKTNNSEKVSGFLELFKVSWVSKDENKWFLGSVGGHGQKSRNHANEGFSFFFSISKSLSGGGPQLFYQFFSKPKTPLVPTKVPTKYIPTN